MATRPNRADLMLSPRQILGRSTQLIVVAVVDVITERIDSFTLVSVVI